MEVLYSWIKSIVFYLILITAVINVLPDNGYKKYVKLFTGMMLVVLLISPLAKLLNFEDTLNFQYDSELYKQELTRLQNGNKYLETAQTSQLVAAYESEIKQNVKQIVANEGLYPSTIDIRMNEDPDSEAFGTVEEINILASYQEKSSSVHIDPIEIGKERDYLDSYEAVNIKNEIEDFYNISASNINISIQR